MATRKIGFSHPDVEFAIGNDYFENSASAVEAAVARALSRGEPVVMDIIVSSRKGAKAFMGDYGVEVYDEDPDASVFQRIVITVEDQGRIA
jgi:hypothetical protein